MRHTKLRALGSLLLLLALLLCACSKKTEDPAQSDPASNETTGTESQSTPLDGLDLGQGLSVVSAGAYAGLFVEDGTDETVSDVFALQLTNTSETDVQYAHLTLTRGDEVYDFDFSTLPVGKTLQVLEQNRKTLPEDLSGFTPELTLFAAFETPMSLHDDVIQLDPADGAITVTNTGEAAVSQLYVYYKTVQNDLLMGGITYRASLGDVAPGETKTAAAAHFTTADSQVLFVTYGA